MKDKLTVRDRLAMSMPEETLPTLENRATVELIAEKFGLEWSEDPMVQMEFVFQYQAIIRYQYADAMMSVRGR